MNSQRVVLIANVPAFYVMATPEIRTVEDLKGKTGGRHPFWFSSSNSAMCYVLQKHEKDVMLIQLGGILIELATTPLSKKVDCGCSSVVALLFFAREKASTAIGRHF